MNIETEIHRCLFSELENIHLILPLKIHAGFLWKNPLILRGKAEKIKYIYIFNDDIYVYIFNDDFSTVCKQSSGTKFCS